MRTEGTRALVLAAVALLAVGLANVDIKPVRTKIITRTAPTKTVVREKVKVVRVPEQVRQPDGYMSLDNCSKLAKRTDFRDVIFRYGWPAGDDGSDSYAGYLMYPLSEDHSKICIVDFWDGGVERTDMEVR